MSDLYQYLGRRPESAASTRLYTNFLDGLEIDAFLGIHPPELAARQRVIVNVEMLCEYEGALEDRIESVLDYDFLREGILAMARDDRFALQETLCERIAALCWECAHVQVVRVSTMKPDIYPEAKAIGCRIVRVRPG